MAGSLCSKDTDSDKKSERMFGDKLSDFGYEFKDGKLRDIGTGGPFQFVVVEGNQTYNQRHYEALGEVITEEVYKLLETECNLIRQPVPYDYNENNREPSTFIFVSHDALTNPDKLLVLIHGSGVVRAGQWARRLIINDCLDSGTQIPFIKEAQKQGYGILVMNTNDNSRQEKKRSERIRGSENPEKHAAHVWEHYIKKAKAKHIALIAHSYGGCVTTALFQKEKEDFRKRVFAVAMTDSVHFISNTRAFKDLVKVSCNWVSSQKPLDTPLSSMPGDIKRVSAGVNVHEQTSWSSFSSVFKFLQKRYDAVTKEADEEADEGVAEEEDSARTYERSMSTGSVGGDDSALGNTDIEMSEAGGEGDNTSKEEDGDDICEKVSGEGPADEGTVPEREVDQNNKSSGAKTTKEGGETDKPSKIEDKTEEEGSPDVEMAEDGKTEKPSKKEDKTKGEGSPDVEMAEDGKTEKPSKDEGYPDVGRSEKETAGAHSISDSEEEGDEHKKQKKDK